MSLNIPVMPQARARAYHNRAVSLTDIADRRARDGEECMALRREAALYEIKAARLVPLGVEPSRSVLYRSAAWLAIQAGKPHLAIMLVARGLKGDPPAEIAEELLEAHCGAIALMTLLDKRVLVEVQV